MDYVKIREEIETISYPFDKEAINEFNTIERQLPQMRLFREAIKRIVNGYLSVEDQHAIITKFPNL